jgi:ubiquinone/menaquinone biosynthesis C-methylase UbiE
VDYRNSIREHYGRPELVSAIARAVHAQGRTIEKITREDLIALDEFHIRGRKATQELAQRAGLHAGMKVLDIGCGIGGPARTLAAEFGCSVVGVDMIQEYCDTATWLTQHLGLSEQARFECAEVSDLPFEDNSFDVVWSQHVLANVEDKHCLLDGIVRVLRPNGIFAFFEICAGSVSPPYFPVPWASDGRLHFAASVEDLRSLLEPSFHVKELREISSESLDWYRRIVTKGSALVTNIEAALGIHLLMGVTTQQKMANVVRNLEEDRIRVIEGVVLKA